MSNPNAVPPEETKWKPGQSGNPSGPKPGYKHISTWIQELLNDEEFEYTAIAGTGGNRLTFKGAPLKAIVGVAVHKAIGGDPKWAEWLAKHGYGTKLIIGKDPAEEALKALGLMGDDDAGQDSGTTDETS